MSLLSSRSIYWFQSLSVAKPSVRVECACKITLMHVQDHTHARHTHARKRSERVNPPVHANRNRLGACSWGGAGNVGGGELFVGVRVRGEALIARACCHTLLSCATSAAPSFRGTLRTCVTSGPMSRMMGVSREQSHLISSRLVSSHLVSSHLIDLNFIDLPIHSAPWGRQRRVARRDTRGGGGTGRPASEAIP